MVEVRMCQQDITHLSPLTLRARKRETARIDSHPIVDNDRQHVLASRGPPVLVYRARKQFKLHCPAKIETSSRRSSRTRLPASPIDLIGRAGDPGGLFRCEIKYQIRHLARSSGATDGM